jgi:hypothetical protein
MRMTTTSHPCNVDPAARAPTRTLHVSTSRGLGGNDGRTPDAPLASLAKAVALVHAGRADRLLLRRGDVFLGPLGRWTRGGRSREAPFVIGAFGPGEVRPVIRCRGTGLLLTRGGDAPLRDVLVKGLHFVAAGRDPDEPGYDAAAPAAAGVWVRGPGVSRVTLDDCRVEQFDDNLLLDAARDVVVRRCLQLDAVASRGCGPAHGLAAYACGGVRVESCVFDQNVADESRGSSRRGGSHHHVFAPHGNDDIAVVDSVVSRSPGTALLVAAEENVVTGNVIPGNRLHVAAGGARATLAGNLILGGRDAGRGDEPGRASPAHAIWATSAELCVERNVIAHRRGARDAAVVLAPRGPGVPSPAGGRRARLAGNVLYACGGGIEIAGGGAWRAVKLIDNALQRLAPGQAPVSLRDACIRLAAAGNRYDVAGDAAAAVRFRLAGERLAFDEWAARTGDLSAVVTVRFPAQVVRLAKRFVADARAQSGDAWREHLSAGSVAARFFRAFDVPPIGADR